MILWTALTTVGLALEDKKILVLVVYTFQICFVFMHETMRRRGQTANKRLINYVMDDLFLELLLCLCSGYKDGYTLCFSVYPFCL